MIKRIFAPVQAWLLLQGKCAGCGRDLSLSRKFERQDNSQKAVCHCGRIYIFDKRRGKYRRASFTEASS